MNNLNLQKNNDFFKEPFNYFRFQSENGNKSIGLRYFESEDIIIKNRVYSLVNKKDIHNPKKRFTYGWADNPLSVLEYFDKQKSLPLDKRIVENGEYVVLFSDRDSGKFGEAVWETELPSSHQPGTYTME